MLWNSDKYKEVRAKIAKIDEAIRQIDSDVMFCEWALQYFNWIELTEDEQRAYKFIFDRKEALRQRKEEIVKYCRREGIPIVHTAVLPEEVAKIKKGGEDV